MRLKTDAADSPTQLLFGIIRVNYVNNAFSIALALQA